MMRWRSDVAMESFTFVAKVYKYFHRVENDIHLVPTSEELSELRIELERIKAKLYGGHIPTQEPKAFDSWEY